MRKERTTERTTEFSRGRQSSREDVREREHDREDERDAVIDREDDRVLEATSQRNMSKE